MLVRTHADAPAEAEDPDGDEASAGTASPAGRRLALDVHARLRAMILSGELPPGSVLLQTQVARQLGVSRTPTREAFRLLQEEGLIDARPDQRARVRAVDADDLDGVYGARIMLESLAVSLTVRTLSEADLDRITTAMELMREHAGDDSPEKWQAAHREFHQIATQAVGAHLRRMIESLGERCERYVRLAQLGVAGSWARAERDHQELLTALRARDEPTAKQVIARHLARTALSVMADVAPEREPVATREALRIATGNGG
jgi:DNA-binding GntR family transcriptional regulator